MGRAAFNKTTVLISNFEVDRKSEFLANLAYVLTMSVNGSRYTKSDLVSAYGKMHDNFGLPGKEAAKVANELESHTGLFVQSGYDAFEFSHKSLQEYLTAEFIVRLPSIPEPQRTLLRLPNELAIATAISSQPSLYFLPLGVRKIGFNSAILRFHSRICHETTAGGAGL